MLRYAYEFIYYIHTHQISELENKKIWLANYQYVEDFHNGTLCNNTPPQQAKLVISRNGLLTKTEYKLVTINDDKVQYSCTLGIDGSSAVTSSSIIISFDRDEVVEFYNRRIMARYEKLMHIKNNIDANIQNTINDLFETDLVIEKLKD